MISEQQSDWVEIPQPDGSLLYFNKKVSILSHLVDWLI